MSHTTISQIGHTLPIRFVQGSTLVIPLWFWQTYVAEGSEDNEPLDVSGYEFRAQIRKNPGSTDEDELYGEFEILRPGDDNYVELFLTEVVSDLIPANCKPNRTSSRPHDWDLRQETAGGLVSYPLNGTVEVEARVTVEAAS